MEPRPLILIAEEALDEPAIVGEQICKTFKHTNAREIRIVRPDMPEKPKE